MSFPNGNVQKVHESPEKLHDINETGVQGPERSEEKVTDYKHEPTGETKSKASKPRRRKQQNAKSSLLQT